VTDGEDLVDPVAAFRARLKLLREEIRSPTYRSLEEYAGREGVELPTSTTGTLLNGPGMPRWGTVEAYLRACRRYVRARRLAVPMDRFDLERWHAEYKAMEAALDRPP
jgi:hypothetical protein